MSTHEKFAARSASWLPGITARGIAGRERSGRRQGQSERAQQQTGPRPASRYRAILALGLPIVPAVVHPSYSLRVPARVQPTTTARQPFPWDGACELPKTGGDLHNNLTSGEAHGLALLAAKDKQRLGPMGLSGESAAEVVD